MATYESVFGRSWMEEENGYVVRSVRAWQCATLECGSRGYHVQQTDVPGHGYRAGCESAWSFDGGLYSGHLCAVLLRRELEGEESIRCEVGWGGGG